MGITILDQRDKEELNKKIDDAKKETAKQIDEAIKNSTGPIDPSRIKDMYYTEDGGMVEILPESTAVGSDQSIMGEFYVMGKPITLEVGKTYKVVYNGTEYECVASAISIPTIGEGIGLGDVDILSTGSPSGSYPFVIATADALINMGASIAVLDASVVARAMPLPTVAIYGNATVVYHIPPKYIKDMYYVDGTEEVVIFPEITVPSNTQLPLDQPSDIKPGETYICIVDGVEYECTAIEVGAFIGATFSVTLLGNTLLLNGEDTGEPFYFITSTNEIEAGAYGIAHIDNNKETATVSIKQVKEKIHKLDNKYLDLDWLPIYKEKPIAAFDCTTNNDISGGGSVVDGMKPVSTGVVSSVLTNLNYNKTVTLDNQTAPAAIVTIVLDGVSYDAYCMNMDNYFMIRFDTDMKPLPFIIYNNISGEKLYFGAVVDGDHTVTISAKEPNKIPEDFLPGETKPATTIVHIDDYAQTFYLNERFKLGTSASNIQLAVKLCDGLINKNLCINNINIKDRVNNINYFNSYLSAEFTNYYEIKVNAYITTYCGSVIAEDGNGNLFNISISVNRTVDGELGECYLSAYKLNYDTWTGGSY